VTNTTNGDLLVIQEMLITPAAATQWLANNHQNRPLRKAVISAYASDMTAGRWQQNGETIKRTIDGKLLDGQHRLHAIARAGVAVKMLVIDGLPENSFHTIDTGMRRSNAQLVGLAGHSNSSAQASMARWIVLMETAQPNSMRRGSVTAQQVFDALERHPLVSHFAQRLPHKGIRAFIPAAAISVLVLAAEKYGQALADDFLTSFKSGEGLKKGDPVYELRERLIANSSRVAKLTTQTIVAITIKAVRAYAAQRTLGILRWTPNEEWPAL
jgi:hypothetical protein